ncbi:hypothetical protein IGI04_020000 [Brassica rapa subsp. trilocularis]|uniref:Uncharacterized protein n=1 Tax=Brassica rapa subsp. trilocularis TaxID=1813537 RepID=A0ABQ7MJW7_BRACM|nr:hypothetical protein IGI04_020000 [Brassica rapa subsp. trilocularis]
MGNKECEERWRRDLSVSTTFQYRLREVTRSNYYFSPLTKNTKKREKETSIQPLQQKSESRDDVRAV